MQRGRALFWTITGSAVAAVAVVITLILVNSGTPPKTASSPAPSVSASASPEASKSAPVVIPETSSTSSYLSDLKPSGKLGELVSPGPVTISGSIYPKSISFYCRNGDPAATPEYKLRRNARRFQATIGLGDEASPKLQVSVMLIGDGRTLRTFSVNLLRPKTVDVNVTGIHTLELECFGLGMTPRSGGWAVPLAWGNARVSGGH